MKRNPILFKGRIAQTIFMALLTGFLYFNLSDNYDDVYNRNGAFFFITMNQFMSSMQPVLLTFPSERDLFLKEENSKMYSVTAYYFGRTILEIPLLIFAPVLFTCIVYFMIKLNTADPSHFFIFLLIIIL